VASEPKFLFPNITPYFRDDSDLLNSKPENTNLEGPEIETLQISLDTIYLNLMIVPLIP
jgi:hypothetical protein